MSKSGGCCATCICFDWGLEKYWQTPHPPAGVVLVGSVLWDMWGKCSTPAYWCRGLGSRKPDHLQKSLIAQVWDVETVYNTFLSHHHPIVWFCPSIASYRSFSQLQTAMLCWNFDGAISKASCTMQVQLSGCEELQPCEVRAEKVVLKRSGDDVLHYWLVHVSTCWY